MDFLFILKKLIGIIISPLGLSLLFLVIALLIYKAKPKLSIGSCCFSFAILFLSSFPPSADRLLYTLESQYDALNTIPNKSEYVIVLGCAHTSDDALPALSQLRTCSLIRVVEAVRLYRQNPSLTIITSGSGFTDSTSNAEMAKRAAVELGVPEHKIMTENFPEDTEEEAQLLAPRVKGKGVILVTAANHMPRAVKYFEHYGVNVTPAPTGFMVKNYYSNKDWGYYMPSTIALEKSTRAIYEYIGQLWQWLRK